MEKFDGLITKLKQSNKALKLSSVLNIAYFPVLVFALSMYNGIVEWKIKVDHRIVNVEILESELTQKVKVIHELIVDLKEDVDAQVLSLEDIKRIKRLIKEQIDDRLCTRH